VTAPESLLLELAGENQLVRERIADIGPLLVPFEILADTDGWVIDLQSADSVTSFDDPALGTDQRTINAALVAVDYAIRRGARTPSAVAAVLQREGPIAFRGLAQASTPIQVLIRQLGVSDDFPSAFSRRATGHELSEPFDSDPSLSFEERAFDHVIGDNALSSLAVHTEGEGNQVLVTGALSDRWGVEVGLPDSTPIAALDEIEAEIARMPSFMRGQSSALDDDGIVLGWRTGIEPDPRKIGLVIQAWTRALFDVEFADVRIAFGPPHGRSALLTEMRSRARAYRLLRDQVREERPDPLQVDSGYQLPGQAY
jgi:hypothetical protein